MIDREARNKLAEEIRHFMSCLTDSFQFDDAIFSIKTNDNAVTEIRDQMWHTYDDVWKHKLKGKKALPESEKEIIKRFVLFLKTDMELEKGSNPVNRELWPFISPEQYNSALSEPRYLNNAT